MSTSISGLVVEYVVAIDVTRVRFPADAFCSAALGPPASNKLQNSDAGTRTRVARVKAEYPNQLDYIGSHHRISALIPFNARYLLRIHSLFKAYIILRR